MVGLGAFVGGLMGVLLLSLIWEKLLFKRVTDDPLIGKVGSVAAAWLTAGTIGGWGLADGGEYQWRAFGVYFFPALVIGALAVRAGLRSRRELGQQQ